MLDPVRFISNLSTGRMGYMLAEVARKRKHKVVLISAPTSLTAPAEVEFISVISTQQMLSAVKRCFSKADCLIMCAAVADYRPYTVVKEKIRRAKKSLLLRLIQTPDILAQISREKAGKILVGFSLEDKDYIKRSREKLKRKGLDFIVVNRIQKGGSPFGESKVYGAILDKEGDIERFKGIGKEDLAQRILNKVEALWARRSEKEGGDK